MNDIARLWQEDFNRGIKLLAFDQPDSLKKALNLFSHSARSFPDSWLAPQAHYYRAKILEKLGDTKEAEEIRQRLTEYYPLQNDD